MEFEFKKFELTKGEKIWLKAIHERNFENLEVKKIKLELYDLLPKNFSIENVDERLVHNKSWITALGIYFIDPNSNYLNWIEDSIFLIKKGIISGDLDHMVSSSFIRNELSISDRESEIVLRQMYDLGGFFEAGSGSRISMLGMSQASFHKNDSAYDEFLSFESLDQKLEKYFLSRQNWKLKEFEMIKKKEQKLNSLKKDCWIEIKKEYGYTKFGVGKKINFITDPYKRKIIYRDIEQAYIISKQEFHKPAIILVGGIIEELLRLFLASKNVKPKRKQFYHFIKACDENNLLNKPISKLNDSVRDFRNLVHLEKEDNKHDSLSITNSKSALSSLFSLIDNF